MAIYAHNMCPECSALDQPQAILGKRRKTDNGWVERRKCSKCKQKYDYDLGAIVSKHMDALQAKKMPKKTGQQTLW